SIVGITRPPWLKLAVVGLPTAQALCVALDLAPPMIIATVSGLSAIGGHLTGGILLARNALRTWEWDQALLAAPFLLVAWYGLRDMGIILGTVEGGLLLGSKARPLTTVAVLVLLMRRLAYSLGEL